MAEEFQQGRSRTNQRAKRRKTNIVLNTLILIVVLLIVIVCYFIFAGGKKTPTNQSQSNHVTSANNHKSAQSSDEDKNQSTDSDKEKTEDGNTVLDNNNSDSNVKETYSNDSWKAVGTSQNGHQYGSSTDWNERVQALSEATGIDKNNLTIWFLEKNGDESHSIGTVTEKGNENKIYRIYLDWQDGEGWKPTKIELLKHNDKKS